MASWLLNFPSALQFRRQIEFLEALADERVPHRGKLDALLRVWDRRAARPDRTEPMSEHMSEHVPGRHTPAVAPVARAAPDR